jgi:amidase
MPFFGQEHVESAAEKGGLDEEDYQKAMQMYQAYRDTLLQLMEEHQLDAFVAPSGGPSWVTDLVNGDHFGGGSSSYAAITGFSNITVPAGHVHGLPIGLSFIAGPFAEPTILKLAYAFEQTTQHRQPPQFLETIE